MSLFPSKIFGTASRDAYRFLGLDPQHPPQPRFGSQVQCLARATTILLRISEEKC